MTSYQPNANWTPETLTRSLQYHLTQSVDRAVCTVAGRAGKSLGSRMHCAARPLVLAVSARALSIALQLKGKTWPDAYSQTNLFSLFPQCLYSFIVNLCFNLCLIV